MLRFIDCPGIRTHAKFVGFLDPLWSGIDFLPFIIESVDSGLCELFWRYFAIEILHDELGIFPCDLVAHPFAEGNENHP